MRVIALLRRQIMEIRVGGLTVFIRKFRRLPGACVSVVSTLLALPVALAIRLLRPWITIRLGGLISSRIGHFAMNTELYLCERDARINVPSGNYVDFLYLGHHPVCNRALVDMWKRVFPIWPRWLLGPIDRANRIVPSGAVHSIGGNATPAEDRRNLLDRFPPHLKFTPEEEAQGKAALQRMGIDFDTPFVCLFVRDSAYLDSHLPPPQSGGWGYHNFRDSDIKNYVPVTEELAHRGYFVIRMGAKVHAALPSKHPRVIDYASNGLRSEFLDIYLGANCAFCISTGAGWDAIPEMFRRPIVHVNFCPLWRIRTSRTVFLSITKKHVLRTTRAALTMREIFTYGVENAVAALDYTSRGVELVENTPEEIRDIVIEMAERLEGKWQPHENDEILQRRFWEIFQIDAVNSYDGLRLHGEIRGRFGAAFLRNNPGWLQ